jgi:hypothetical protein
MADDSPPTKGLIAGRFAVDASVSLPDAGGGLPAFMARDRQAADSARVALLVSRGHSPRANALSALSDPIDNLMGPLGHGIAAAPGGKSEAYYIVCPSPPGPPLSASLRPWPERALIDHVLKPIARALDTLHGHGLTHRAIRAGNVFQGAPGQPVTLGAAWSAPPAMHQPCVYEPPYNAMCHPAARGAGVVGDDVYALGVLLLVLAAGRVPFAGQDDSAVIRAKLEVGSFNALVRDVPISGFMADLLRGMLAQEAEHRPPPSLLLDPSAARARRVAARPPRRSQRPLMIGESMALEARTLAFALLRDEKRAIQALRGDVVTTWLRRGLGDAALASSIEERVRDRLAEVRPTPRSDSLLVMRCISTLNPRMPMCWRGVALWPDGLEGLLADSVAQDSDLKAIATELLLNDITELWSSIQTGYDAYLPAPSREAAMARQYLQNGGQGALLRLFYMQNPLLPCRAPSMAAIWCLGVADAVRAIERSAASATGNLVDAGLAAFVAARSDQQTEVQINTLLGRKDPELFRLGEIGLLRDLQNRYCNEALPNLAKWAAARLRPELEKWRNRRRRAAMAAQVAKLAQAGFLAPILQLVTDSLGLNRDAEEAERAAATLVAIDAELASIDGDTAVRYAIARRTGHAMTGAIGLTVLIVVVILAVAP